MSYIGSTPTTQSFIAGTDYFNGTGSATAFTLSRSVVSANDIQATVNNVVQQPNDAYTVSGTTITFTSAPSAGTNNVYVRYLSTTTQSITPSQNTVSYSTLNSDNQSKLGISFKNRVINGAMTIAQRGTSGTATSAGSIVLDRFGLYSSNTTPAVTQSSDAPAGFSNSMLWTQSSAATRTSSDYYEIYHKIEGYNIADLNLGTANAKTVTVSFWVKSSVVGTYSFALANSSATYQNYVTTYTINSANTWEQKTITVTGSTTGTWNTTNGIGLELWWDLGSGSTYQTSTLNSWLTGSRNSLASTSQVGFAQTAGATWAVTGVMLEVGTQATTFDYRSYGQELLLCQRYCQIPVATNNNSTYFSVMWAYSANSGHCTYLYPVPMRTTPSLTSTSGSSYWTFYANQNGGATFPSFSLGQSNATSCDLTANSFTTTAGFTGGVYITNNAAQLILSAEL